VLSCARFREIPKTAQAGEACAALVNFKTAQGELQKTAQGNFKKAQGELQNRTGRSACATGRASLLLYFRDHPTSLELR